MKIQIKEGHAGVMILKDGTQMNYGVIRITRNMTKMVFYTGMGLRELFKPGMKEDEKAKADQLKKMDEKALMKLGYISEMLLSNIKVID